MLNNVKQPLTRFDNFFTCKTTGGLGVKAASDSPPPGLANVVLFFILLSALTLISEGFEVRPSGSPLLRTYEVKAPPKRFVGKAVRLKGGRIRGIDLQLDFGVLHTFNSLSECEKSLSTEAKDSKLLDESIDKLLGASCVSGNILIKLFVYEVQ